MRNVFVIMTIYLFWFVAIEDVSADSDSFEKIYRDGGYQEIYKTLQES
ncbi:hypothetical protein QTL97_09685 [Sporosarcina thermotolerans]|uniref:Uncharacterized protein n=1 Tax=Sporosarcina thermotolerans TaxID=633404 RepID=A0AAW9AC31_9BACL|nr:hypothetical protein [Sporosarcina thermotolerans]MDW0117208.1 hypothetical protein [Sporosarcina thermotolerans]WHT47379.1 hypothetical protein QNH10_14400 [Sporosarcina thermotolerans]